MDEEPRLTEPAPPDRPLVYSGEPAGDSGGFPWRWVLIGCGGALLLACVCLVAAAGTYAFLTVTRATPTPQFAATTPAARPARTATVGSGSPTPATAVQPAPRGTPSPSTGQSSGGLPAGWQWFDDPSGQVRLAVPGSWNFFYEEKICCNVTLVTFDPGQLPSGRIAWAPPGSGAAHEVPAGEMVVDLFIVAPPYADQPPDFGRPPDGEDIVGGRYHAQLYFSAPYTDWPSGQVITYLYQDDRGRQWCLIAYFGTPFEQDTEHLAMLGQIVASIQHPS